MAKDKSNGAAQAAPNPTPDDDEDIHVDVAASDGQGDSGTSGATNEPEDVDGLKAALAEAQKKAADNAKAAQEADRRLNEERAQREAEKRTSKTEVTDARLQTVQSALNETEVTARDLKSRLTAAYEAGDGKQIAELTLESSELAAKRQRLAEGKAALESAIQQEKEAAQQQPADPVEAYTRGMAPRAQAWIKGHAEVVTDPVKRNELERAHWRAKGMGFAEGSDDYFQYIEGEMGYGERFNVDDEPAPESRTQPQRRTMPAPAAPVSRDGASANGGSRTTQVRLTVAEREAARISGMSDAEYAAQKLAIQRDSATTH
jgi:hypothetical protein